ncbi:MAG: hypothetical protein APF76_10620 [Desulfitibacter sp. BRH_c19]|nr:MAG: hypothetical protein APF76_10620 [Desulfitibacter sp. BRH_c19]
MQTYQDSDPQVDIFLQELMEWIVRECQVLDDLLDWTEILTHYVSRRFRALVEEIRAAGIV